MIDLEIPSRSVAGVDLAGDDQDPFTYWVLSPPRIALTPDGTPLVSLLRIVQNGQLTGAVLDLTVELPIRQEAINAARAQLMSEVRNERDRERVTLSALPLLTAEAELLFLGKETRPDGGLSAIVRRTYGWSMPKLLPPYTASFSVVLTSDGARLAEAALRSGGAPVGIVYRLQVEALRPAQQVVVHVDYGRVYDQMSTERKEGTLFTLEDIRTMVEHLRETRAVTVKVIEPLVPDPAAPKPDTAAALDWVTREIVDKFCQPVLPLDRRPARASLGTLGEMFGVGSVFGFKNITQIERASADVDFSSRSVVVRTLTQTAHLADMLGDAPASGHITDAAPDNPFFQTARLHVTSARPLAATFVKEVAATFTYGPVAIPIRLAAGPDGPTDGSAEAYADKSPTHTWTLPMDITMADDAPVDPGVKVHVDGPRGQGRELTLDLEALLGLRAVDVLGSSDTRVLMTNAELEQVRGDDVVGEARRVIVDPTQPKATAWFRDFRAGDTIRCTTHHLLADQRIIDLAPAPVTTRLYRLPAPFPGAMTVQLLSDDDWNGITKLVIALQKNPELPASTFELTKNDSSRAVSLDLPDPLDRKYRYKVDRWFDDDHNESDDWMTTDASVLFIGRVAANKLVVDVKTLGDLELPQAGITSIEVLLQYLDPANLVRAIQTVELRARADTYHWEVAIKDPAHRSYQYQVTVHRNSGRDEVGPFTTTTERVLVIPITRG
jgi:hypothetical protein